MKYAHILSRVTGTPWFITTDALWRITALLESRIVGSFAESDEGKVRGPADNVRKGTAVVPVFGVIGKRISAMEMACGGTDVDAVARAFDAANKDPDVDRILLHVDSPGGTVTGVPELAEHIYNVKTKPVTAVSDTMMASAAYYIASASDDIVVTPTAVVGSIGVSLQVREASADEKGPRLRIFRSGADKAMGVDAQLTDSQAAGLQAQVDWLGDMFRADVRKTRTRVGDESMTGMTYFGADAVRRGLVDRVVRSLSEVMS